MIGSLRIAPVGLLAVAAATWSAAATARWWGPWPAVAVVAASAVWAGIVDRRRMAAMATVGMVVAAGAGSGLASSARERSVLEFESTPGRIESVVRLRDDVRRSENGWWVLAVPDPPEPGRPPAAPMLLSLDDAPDAGAGELVEVTGHRISRAGRARGDPYSGVVDVTSVEPIPGGSGLLWRAGNAVRSRALDSLRDRGPEKALLAGFLVGDTSGVPEADLEAMRRSGLSHLVAVSGSNVALFLAMTLLALGPLSAGPRRRAAVGLAALAVLVVATRWEPSVVRASIMAAMLLLGRVCGWAPDALTALSGTVIGVVVVAGELATDVGFTLSVLATVGVVVGSWSMPPSLPAVVAGPIGATVGAQLLVAPVLITVFGSIPLMAPVTNLIAVPVVAASTVVGTVGLAVGSEAVVDLASMGAEVVLAIARQAAAWPQLGAVGVGVVVAMAAVAMFRPLRPIVALVGAASVAVAMTGGGIVGPALVVFDVGQGDSILLVGSDDSHILVDGGPDPALLEQKLSEYGVHHLDLVVLTHVHADHASGLAAVFGRRGVDVYWPPGEPHSTAPSRHARAAAEAAGVRIEEPPVGDTVSVGQWVVEVLGPKRRYASPNDQSTVLRVRAGDGPVALLTGDAETFAQADLSGVTADVLKVPHQGGDTSELGWLAAVGASQAVISVGPNEFGHPSPDVVEALEAAGAAVTRTDHVGDVVIGMGPGGRLVP